MKTLKLAIIATFFAMPVFAGQLPIQVNRNADGSVDTIVLVDQKAVDGQEAQVFLDGLTSGIDQVATYKGDAFEGAKKLKKDEQQALEDAKAFLSSKSDIAPADRKKMNEEFVKAVRTLNHQQLFHVLASPGHPGAFDGEKILVEVVSQILGQAGKVLGVSPAYSVFEFLVEEYMDALVARREFFQNAVLSQLDHADGGYSAADASGIRSSIFYSRLDLWNLPKRQKAVKAWATFGDNETAKWMKKCKTTSATYAQSCFIQEGQKVRNIMVSKFKFSKKSSLAVDLTKPTSVGNTRWMILAVKLGVKLAPVPGLAKKPVNMFLNSLYAHQRRSEGLLYGELVLQNADDLANVVSGNNANPTF